jgi:antitoxin (DNA-binding transcriptional repressor) of toxin-antitoxin stability system
MATVIAQRQLRNENAAIMAAVAAGTTFVVTRNGSPVAELRPIRRERRVLVPKGELATLAASGPAIDAAAFRADLDRAVDQSWE